MEASEGGAVDAPGPNISQTAMRPESEAVEADLLEQLREERDAEQTTPSTSGLATNAALRLDASDEPNLDGNVGHEGPENALPRLSPDLSEHEAARLEALGRGVADLVQPLAWADSTPIERAEMLQGAHDYAARGLGIESPQLLSYAEDFSPNRDFGTFNPETRQVVLGSWLLDRSDPSAAVETVAHETYHDFQQRVVDGELPHEREEAWRSGSEAYGNFDDFDDYMANPLERDAYAVEAPFMHGYRREAT